MDAGRRGSGRAPTLSLALALTLALTLALALALFSGGRAAPLRLLGHRHA